jgi:hypothetical protein
MAARAVSTEFANANAVAVEMAMPGGLSAAGGSEMRDRLIVVRDTLIVLGIQIAFRMGLLMRRWNM